MSTSLQFTYTISDRYALQIIEYRRPIVQSHFVQWCECALNEGTSIPLESTRTSDSFVIAVEHFISKVKTSDIITRVNALTRWQNMFLIPLARDLQLIERTELKSLERCHRRGWFDQVINNKRCRPKLDAIVWPVQSILTTVSFTTRRIHDLVAQGYCVDERAAESVVRTYDRATDQAVGLARGIALAYEHFGDVGLLLHSQYPCTEELLDAIRLIEQHELVASIPSDVIEELLSDVVALHKVLSREGLWQRRLLHDPSYSAWRDAYKRSLWPHTRERLIQGIAKQRCCDKSHASVLLKALVDDSGFSTLLEIRYRNTIGTPTQVLQYIRVQTIIDAAFSALSVEDRQQILALVTCLHDAMQETGVELPLLSLLKRQPSDSRRRRIGRHVWFSLSSLARYKQRHRRRRRPWQDQHKKRNRSSKRASPSARGASPIDRLVAAFAQRADIEQSEARNFLRGFITYGAIVFLGRSWYQCLDHRIYSWLKLIKWGRLEGRVPWNEVLRQANVYWQAFGLNGCLSSQLLRPIFNSIPRPRYWHGGQGEATATVQQRGSLALPLRQQLHQNWIIVPISIPISMCDATGRTVSITSHMLLVFDKASGLFMGGWPSPYEPGETELCLAVYQSIWHPSMEPWLVHGIPEMITIPQTLAAVGFPNLRQAATYLLANIDSSLRPWQGLRQITQLLRQFKANPPHASLLPEERTQGRVLLIITEWFRQVQLEYHRGAPVWASIRNHGVDMPGHDSPAAGWLLPRSDDHIEVFSNKIMKLGRQYESNGLHLLDGTSLVYREYPLAVLTESGISNRHSIFIELPTPKGIVLHHLLERR